MRTFVLALAGVSTAFLVLESTGSAQQFVSNHIVSSQTHSGSSTSYVCPKCGKVHSGPESPATNLNSSPVQSVQSVSYQSPSPIHTDSAGGSLQSSGGVSNVLAPLNSQRARQGIGSLRYDPELQAVAQRRAQQMASMGLKNHPPGSFAPGRYEGVGWSSSFSPSGVSACYTSDPGMQSAGAAMATGRDGVYFAVVYR